MVPNIPPEAARTLLSSLLYRPDAVTPNDIKAGFPTPPDETELQRWLDELVAAGILQVDTRFRPHRYLTTENTVEYYRSLPAAVSNEEGVRSNKTADSPERGRPAPQIGTDPQNSAQPSPGDPQPVTNTGGDAAASFPTCFDSLVFKIVVGVMPFSGALPFLQQQAQLLVPPDHHAAFVRYALERLSHLSLGECARYGIEPAQYELWRRQYFPPTESAGKSEVEGVRSKVDESASPPPEEKREEFERRRRTPPAEKPEENAAEDLNRRIEAIIGGKPLPKWAEALGAGWIREQLAGMPLPVVLAVVGLSSVAFGGIMKALTGNPWLAGGAAALILGGFYLQRRPENAKSGTRNAETAPIRQSLTPSVPGALASRRKAVAWLVVAALLVALAGGILWYRLVYQRPSQAAVREYLTAAIAPLPMQVAVLGVPSRVPGTTGVRVTYEVRFETTAPLYRKVDTAAYLRTHFPQEMAAIDAAQALLAGPNGARLRELLAGGNVAANVAGMSNGEGVTGKPLTLTPNSLLSGEVALLATSTPAGASALASGTLLAWRRNNQWAFSGDPIRLDPPPVGEPKPDGAEFLVLEAPADLARLNGIVATGAATAAKVQAAAVAIAKEAERDRQQRLANLARWFRPQTLFTGTVFGVSAPGGSARFAFEITAHEPESSQVSAVLHNDGGWSDARVFQGEWTPSASADACTLILRTTRDDLIESGGPLLDSRSDWGVALKVTADGTPTVDTSNQAVRGPAGTTLRAVRRIDPENAATVREEFSGSLPPLLTATKVGLIYRGTVTSRLRATPETLLLRFTAQDPAGSRVEATLSSPANPWWVRPFRGGIIDNKYRGGSTPIRLQTLDADRVSQAATGSMLAAATGGNGVALNLRVDGTRLVGQDNSFSYVFEPTTEENEKRESGKLGAVGSGGTGGAAAPNNGSEAAPNNSGASRAAHLPAFPAHGGAYVLSDDEWVALPRNNARALQTVAQLATAKLRAMALWEDAVAGKISPPETTIVAGVVFDGKERVPAVPAENVVVVYVGTVPPLPADVVNKYPHLRDYPAIEMAAAQFQRDGTRISPLVLVAPDLKGFWARRLEAKIQQPAAAITVLSCKLQPPPGHYALLCGAEAFELAVQ